jgi:3-oxoacyl-[acyl-carrier protein] reductase
MSSTISFGLAGRVVVITGASNGIGAACARRLARDGARVALWDVAEAPGHALAAELRAPGRTPASSAATSRPRPRSTPPTASTISEFGRIDGLVNNAGIFRAAEFLDVTEEDWDAVINVNLKGSFLVGQAVARHMVGNKRGAIVNMSSVNGLMAIATIASYNASKGGINQLTRAMSLG